jgi:hypothetical protein
MIRIATQFFYSVKDSIAPTIKSILEEYLKDFKKQTETGKSILCQ